jgi:chromosome segregation ATPase
MASAAGDIFDEYHGDAMAIAEQLVQARAEMELLRLRAGQLADALGETQDDLGAAKGSAAKARKALTELRARDEATKAVEQAWRDTPHDARDVYGALISVRSRWPDLGAALDALARTYETGGTDR